MSRANPDPTWANSYDVDDPRAQVASVWWTVTQGKEHAFAFIRVLKKYMWEFAAHIRKPGQQMPISANDIRTFDALVGHMDFATGECFPSIDRIAATARLSRSTVIRSLQTLRAHGIIDWVRRTVKTGNAPGNGPARVQTSSNFWINLAKLPLEILRALRQKLGEHLKEKGKRHQGSGAVRSRAASKVAGVIAGLRGALGGSLSREQAQRRSLASASSEQLLTHMYGADQEARRQHEIDLETMRSFEAARRPSFGTPQSVRSTLYPSYRTKGQKD